MLKVESTPKSHFLQNNGIMPARTERYLPERMNSFIQAGVRTGNFGILE